MEIGAVVAPRWPFTNAGAGLLVIACGVLSIRTVAAWTEFVLYQLSVAW
jgi:hypothetical protein